MSVFLDDSLWPEGISFRRFVHMRDKNNSNNDRLTQRQPIISHNGQ